MIFFTFHIEGQELHIKLDAIIGFRDYKDGSHCLFTINETFFVDEDWDFVVSRLKMLESAAKMAVFQGAIENGH